MENQTIFIFCIWQDFKKCMQKAAHGKQLEMSNHQEFWARENPENPINSVSYFRVLLEYILFSV